MKRLGVKTDSFMFFFDRKFTGAYHNKTSSGGLSSRLSELVQSIAPKIVQTCPSPASTQNDFARL
eukprot:3774217-Amphidinium_carterae.1